MELWSGRAGGSSQMNRLSLRNNRLKLETAGILPIFIEGFLQHTPISWRNTGGYQHVTGWTCKHWDLSWWVCPKNSPWSRASRVSSPHHHRLLLQRNWNWQAEMSVSLMPRHGLSTVARGRSVSIHGIGGTTCQRDIRLHYYETTVYFFFSFLFLILVSVQLRLRTFSQVKMCCLNDMAIEQEDDRSLH